MTKLEAIIEEARALSPADRIQLAKTLLEATVPEAKVDEEALGLRGLLAWAESNDENWFQYYPDHLKAH